MCTTPTSLISCHCFHIKFGLSLNYHKRPNGLYRPQSRTVPSLPLFWFLFWRDHPVADIRDWDTTGGPSFHSFSVTYTTLISWSSSMFHRVRLDENNVAKHEIGAHHTNVFFVWKCVSVTMANCARCHIIKRLAVFLTYPIACPLVSLPISHIGIPFILENICRVKCSIVILRSKQWQPCNFEVNSDLGSLRNSLNGLCCQYTKGTNSYVTQLVPVVEKIKPM